MNTIVKMGLLMSFWLASVVAAQAQAPSRLNDKQVESLLKRLEENADRFRNSFDNALKKSRLNDTKEKDRAKEYVKDFEDATDHLKDRFSKNNSASGDVEEVLKRAAKIDDVMEQDILDSRAQNDWRSVRNSLDELARAYNVSWRWNRRAYGTSPIRQEDMRSLVDRIERDSNRFHESLNEALDRGHFSATRSGEERIHEFVEDFEAAIDRLKDHLSTNDSAERDIEDLLHRGERIDRFMTDNRLDARAQEDWRTLRRDLDELAKVYDIAWNWKG